MKLFTDIKEREWRIDLTIGSARLIDERMKERFNGLSLLDANIVLGRLSDVFFAADLLWLVCKDQAEGEGITEEEFGRSIGGLVLFAGRNALLEEYIDFFPDPAVQSNLRTVVKRTQEMRDLAEEEIAKETTRQIERLKEKISGIIASGSLPDPESPTGDTGQ